jgi:hypothetical protein
VRDPERAALQITNPAAEYDAALLATIVAKSMSSALRKPKSRCSSGVPPYFW